MHRLSSVDGIEGSGLFEVEPPEGLYDTFESGGNSPLPINAAGMIIYTFYNQLFIIRIFVSDFTLLNVSHTLDHPSLFADLLPIISDPNDDITDAAEDAGGLTPVLDAVAILERVRSASGLSIDTGYQGDTDASVFASDSSPQQQHMRNQVNALSISIITDDISG